MTGRRAAAIAGLALVCAFVAGTLVATSDHESSKVATLALALSAGLAFVGSGIVGRLRRPENSTGILLLLVGFTWFLGGLPGSNDDVVFSLGWAIGSISFGFLIHLVVAFPTGRLETRAQRLLVFSGYGLAALVNPLLMLFDDLRAGCEGCPRNVFLVSHEPLVADAIQGLRAGASVLIAVALVAMLVRRWRRATPALRRALTPVLAAGGVTLAAAAAVVVSDSTRYDRLYWLFLVVFPSVPVAFLLGLLRTRLATGAAGRLLVETPDAPTQAEAELGLRHALRDPTLELAFWRPERGGYVDATGLPFTVTPDDPRLATPIDLEGEPLALVVHDSALADEPDAVRGVLAAAKLALQRDRLNADLHARLTELQQERDFTATVVDNAPAFFAVLDTVGRIERFNATLADLTGLADDERVRGRAFWDVFVIEAARDAARAAFEQRVQTELEHEWIAARETRIVSWHITPLPGDKLLISGVDITDRRRMLDEQAALRRVATLVAQDPGPTVVLEAVTREVGLLFDGDAATIFRYRDRHNVTVMGGWSDSAERRLERGAERFLGGDTTSVRVHRTHAPARIDDYADVEGEFARWLREEAGVRSSIAAPVIVAGTLWGGISVSSTRAHAFAPGAEERLGAFAGLVSQAIANAEARRELRGSAARIVEAGDAERQRLERNLHDGAQQRLVALSLSLRLAQNRLAEDPEAASTILSSASIELAFALEELRELARGLHPAILTDRGLASALEGLAARSPVAVELHLMVDERLSEPVEAALFYVAAEALTNVAKYAEATVAHVRVAVIDGAAVIEVEDDGVGGADPAHGSGIRGLTDRVNALDGTLEVHSDLGAGTLVRAEVPLPRVTEPVGVG